MPAVLRRFAVKHNRVARWIWKAVLQVWVTRSAVGPVAEVARRGTPTLVVINEFDSVQFEPSLYWSFVCRRLRRRGLLELERVPGSDHSLYTPEGHDRAAAYLVDWIVDRCAPPGVAQRSRRIGTQM